ncbi:hypothetical protein [Streptomyces umbrinus]|uniref:hypothetical protein n=1 Tax=Streptomyces umbrinus TaxID=67370 RepID=UPI003C2E57E7
MDATTILAAVGSLVVLLGAAARLPAAAAEVVRACVVLIEAAAELRDVWRKSSNFVHERAQQHEKPSPELS